jgi:uncharacterized OB-fold protein
MLMLAKLRVTAGGWLQRWWNRENRQGQCASCGTTVTPPLTECLVCLGERHW